MRLSLGPVLYYWDRETLRDFYRSVTSWPVDRVYLGETVCAKRRAFTTDDWLDLALEMLRSGKEVVMSSLTLIEARSEAGALRRICQQGWPIEANDYTAVELAADNGLPFVGGTTLNLYNRPAIEQLTDAGMCCWVPPLEMSAVRMAVVMGEQSLPVDTELLAFGRMPLAWSARCFAARAHGRPKDDCGFVCEGYPDGMPMETQEHEDFLVINGIQTQSARCLDLLPYLEEIRGLGVDAVRLSPQSHNMADIVARWADAIAGRQGPVLESEWLVAPRADGYWRGEPGMDAVREP